MRTALALAAVAAVGGIIAGPAATAWADFRAEHDQPVAEQGYTVNIDRIGTGPMSKCVVTNVRNPQTLTQWVPYTGPGRGNNRTILVPVVTSQTISVSLDCSAH